MSQDPLESDFNSIRKCMVNGNRKEKGPEEIMTPREDRRQKP